MRGRALRLVAALVAALAPLGFLARAVPALELASTDWLAGTGFGSAAATAVVVDPANSSHLVAGSSLGEWVSNDRGVTWSAGSLPGSITAMAWCPDGRLYAAVGPSISVSTSGGTSWSADTTPLTLVHSIACEPAGLHSPAYVFAGGAGGSSQSGPVVASYDGGPVWTQPVPNNLPGGGVINTVSVASDGSVYAGGDGADRGAWRVAEDLVVWQSLGLAQPVLSIAESPVLATLLFAGTPGGLFRTFTGGQSWSQSTTGFGVPAIALPDPVTVVIGTSGQGSMLSTDAGGTFLSWSQGLPPLSSVGALTADPDGVHVFAGAAGATGSAGVYVRRTVRDLVPAAIPSVPAVPNVGVPTPPPLPSIPPAPSPLIPSPYPVQEPPPLKGNFPTGWLPMNTGFQYPPAPGLQAPSSFVYWLAYDPALPAIMYAGTIFQGVWKSLDAGATWTPLQPACLMADAAPTGVPQASWTQLRDLLVSVSGSDLCYVYRVVADPAMPETVWTAGLKFGIVGGVQKVVGGGVYRSDNGGLTWTAVMMGVPITALEVYRPAIGSPAQLVAGAFFNNTSATATTYGVYRSFDSGATWSAPVGLTNITGCALDNNLLAASVITSSARNPANPANIFVTSAQGVFESTDWGASFVNVLNFCSGSRNQHFWSVAIDPGTGGGISVGSEDVYRSQLSGTSVVGFTKIFNDTASGQLQTILIDRRAPTTEYVAITMSGLDGVWKLTDNGSGGLWSVAPMADSEDGALNPKGNCRAPAPLVNGVPALPSALFYSCSVMELSQSPLLDRLIYAATTPTGNEPGGVYVRSAPTP
ncbi:MAG: WD40/YVTN/BNR-like repeat-containing protein [Candidatus Dormibacteria bacterium]